MNPAIITFGLLCVCLITGAVEARPEVSGDTDNGKSGGNGGSGGLVGGLLGGGGNNGLLGNLLNGLLGGGGGSSGGKSCFAIAAVCLNHGDCCGKKCGKINFC